MFLRRGGRSAANLEMELSEYADNLSAVAELIEELALLAPEYDADDREL